MALQGKVVAPCQVRVRVSTVVHMDKNEGGGGSQLNTETNN